MDEYMPILKSTNKEAQCAICSHSAKEICSSCEIATYCSAEHQIVHWKNHRNDCLPYKILHDEVLGRYAVAVRDLLPGEVFLRESPVTIGPKHYTPPICLGCLSPIHSAQDLRLCTLCSWPACSKECENLSCHAENECPIFAAAHIRFLWNPTCVGGVGDVDNAQVPDNPMLQCITPLRLLLAKERDPMRWTDEVIPMEAHMKERQDSHTWKSDLVNVSGFLRKACRLADRFSNEDILWACGILQVNAFEAHSGCGGSAQCLFPRLAIFSHDCVPNVTHSIDSHFNMVGRVAVAVSRGQPLNTCYTHTLSPTLERRKYLRFSKFFDCNCNRCTDPKELGTNSSTLLCKNCSDYSQGEILSTNPLDPNATWQCNRCGEERSVLSVELLLDSLEARLPGTRMRDDTYRQCPDDLIELEEALQCCSTVLHPTHSMLSCLRFSLSQIYGNTSKLQLTDFLHIMLEHKVQLCKSILAVADIVKPGLTRLRGTTLYELYDPLVLLAQNTLNKAEISYEDYYKSLTEAIKFLEEAVTILSLEESGSIEAKMGRKAKAKLCEMQKAMTDKKILHPQQISEKTTLLNLKEIFADLKIELNSEENELQRAKERDEDDLIKFANDIMKVSYTSTDTSVTLPDLTDIILSLENETSKDANSNNAPVELEVFKKMIESIEKMNL